MKKHILYSLLLVSFSLQSCNSGKQLVRENLYENSWELKSIDGYTEEAFESLYPDKKPHIFFDKESLKVQGTNSCNGYSADYTLDGESISFGEPGPTTMMYCGEGESIFLDLMKKVNKIGMTQDGDLLLLLNDQQLMQFQEKDASF